MKVQRIITDEPIGICVGFTLTDEELEEIGAYAEFWWLEEDDKKVDSEPVFVFDPYGEYKAPPDGSDCLGVISIVPVIPHEEWEDAGYVPFGMDLEVWRSEEVFKEDFEL